jgi:hypothetical protein
VADAEAGPLGVPEEDNAVPRHHIRHPDEVPLVLVAFIQGALNLLPDIRVLIDHKLLGVVSSVLLLWHGLFPFPRLLMFRSISTAPYAQPPFSDSSLGSLSPTIFEDESS